MKQKNLYVLSFLFVFLGISLFACERTETSTLTATNLPTDPSSAPALTVPGHIEVVPPTPFSVLPPTPAPTSVEVSSETALFFLWDDSQSVLETKYCGGINSDYRVELPHFFVNLISEANAKGIKIGLGSMMDDFGLISIPQAPNSLMDLPWAQYADKPLDQLSSKTDYKESLSRVGDLLKGVNADRKVLVLLTDGFISSKIDEIEKEIENLVIQDIQVHVMLLCPDELKEKENDDFEFWTRAIATKQGINVEQSGDPKRWAKILIDNLRSYLPKESVWVSNDSPLENYIIGGNAISFNERWFPFGKTGGDAKLTIDDKTYTLLPHQNISLQLKPDCTPFSLSASVQGGTSGFLIIEPVLPKLKMNFSDAVIENNNDVEFEIDIRATNISSSQLTDRLVCYTLEATLEPDSTRWESQVEITQQPQIRNDGNGGYLQARGKVSHLSYEGPGEIGIRVELVGIGGDRPDVTLGSFVIPVQFRTTIPEGSQQKGQIMREEPDHKRLYKYSLNVNYDLGSNVVIQMETNASEDKLSEGTKDTRSPWYCPKPDNNKRMELTIGVNDLTANNFAGYVRSDYDPKTLEAQFDIYAYQFLSEVCGYNTYYFSWPDNPEYGMVGSRFRCELQDDHFVCEEMTHE